MARRKNQPKYRTTTVEINGKKTSYESGFSRYKELSGGTKDTHSLSYWEGQAENRRQQEALKRKRELEEEAELRRKRQAYEEKYQARNKRYQIARQKDAPLISEHLQERELSGLENKAIQKWKEEQRQARIEADAWQNKRRGQDIKQAQLVNEHLGERDYLARDRANVAQKKADALQVRMDAVKAGKQGNLIGSSARDRYNREKEERELQTRREQDARQEEMERRYKQNARRQDLATNRLMTDQQNKYYDRLEAEQYRLRQQANRKQAGLVNERAGSMVAPASDQRYYDLMKDEIYKSRAEGNDLLQKPSVQSDREYNSWRQRAIHSGVFDGGMDVRNYSKNRKKQYIAGLSKKSEEFQSKLPKTAEEKRELDKAAWEAKGEKGVFEQTDVLGLQITNPDLTGQFGTVTYRKRPEDYYGGNRSYDYDRELYDTLYGSGSYDKRVEELKTDADVEELDREMDDLWKRLEKQTLHELPRMNPELSERESELAALSAGQNPYEQKLKAANRSLELQNRIEAIEASATGTGAYNQPDYRVKTDSMGNYYFDIPGADDLDMSLFYANNQWEYRSQMMYGKGYDGEPHWSQVKAEDFMTPEQVQTLNKLYGSGTDEEKEQAKAYLEALKRYSLNQLKAEYEEKEQRQRAKGPLGAIEGAVTVPVNIVAGAIGTTGSIAALFGNEEAADPYSEWYQLGRYVTNTRDERGNVWDNYLVDKFGEGWKGVGKFLNGVTYSMADNIAAMAVTAGVGGAFGFDRASKAAEVMIQCIMSSEATATEMLQQLKSGKSPTEAAILALGGGMIEAITEKVSIEQLLQPDIKEMLGSPKQLLAFIGKNTLAEGSEEVASDILSQVFDELVSLVNGHESEFKRDVRALREKDRNLTEQDAIRQVWLERLKQYGLSFAGGAMSGFLMSAGRVAGNAVTQRQTGANINSVSEGGMDLVNAALQMPQGTQSRAMAEAIMADRHGKTTGPQEQASTDTVEEIAGPEAEKAGKNNGAQKTGTGAERTDIKIGNYTLGRLAQNIVNETNEQIGKIAVDTVEREARRQLIEMGVDPNKAGPAAAAIAKKVAGGEKLTAAENSAIASSDQAVRLMQDYLTNPMAKAGLQLNILEATQDQRSIRQQAMDLSSGRVQASASAENVAESLRKANVATERDIRTATGTATGAADEVVWNHQIARILRIENGNAVLDVNGQEETADLGEVRTIDQKTAAVVSFARNNQALMSERYANKALELAKDSKAEAGQYLDDAMKIRLAGMSLGAMPRTKLDSRTAEALYSEARAEFAENEETRIANAKPAAKPGEGRATFNGTAYGTAEFSEALKAMPKKVRNQVGALSEIAVRAGFNIKFINDQNNKDVYGFYDQETGEITINMAGEDRDGYNHHLLVTASHEMTHWLEQNSREGYAQLRQFVMDRMRAQGVNVEQRLVDTIDNFNAVMGDTEQTLDLNGAMAELVANGCDQVLGSQAVAEELAKVNPSLYDKVKTFVKDFVARVRAATGGMAESASWESRQLLKETDRIAEIWLGARNEALGQDERTNNASNNEKQYSTAQITNGIEKGMSDFDRYLKIKGTTVSTQNSMGRISNNELTYFGELKKWNAYENFRNLVNRFGLTGTELSNNYIKDKNVVFSNKSLSESLAHQDGGYINLAALMPVFKETFKNAVPFAAQEDRYLHAVKDKTSVKTFTEMLGAFRYGDQIIPVKFDLKETEGRDDQKLYVVATIQKDAISATGPQMSGAATPASIDLSIEDIIENVNSTDKNLLIIIPSQFLTDEQKKGKREALKEEGAYIRTKAERVKKIISYNANMTEERIDDAIDRYGAKGSDNYSKAYMAYIDPATFVKLNTSVPTVIANESRPINGSELRNEKQTPYIRVDLQTGEVSGHEGRHRMQALADAGINRVAILVIPDGTEGRYDRQILDSLKVTGHGNKAELKNLIPVNEKHRQELIDTFSKSDNWFQYSTRQKDTTDWKTYTEENGEMYASDQKGNRVQLTGLDREYVEAWNRNDFGRMEEILADKIRENGAVPFKTPNSYADADHRWVAKAIKEGNMDAIRRAAAEMAEMVPDNAVLVPMPNHHGVVDENTDTAILAKEISKLTGRPVVNALAGIERESRRADKGKPKSQQMTAEDLGFRQVDEIPKGTVPYIVDNVIASGLTAQAAHEALGNNGVTLAYAKSTMSGNAGLKRANVTFYDTNKQYGQYLIPLSERIDMSKTGFTGTKFSIAQGDMDVNTWMLGLNEKMLNTVQERNLLKQYKDLRMAKDVAQMALEERTRALAKLQAKEDKTAYDREQIRKLENQLENTRNKLDRLDAELIKVTSDKGYAGMMYRQQRLMNELVNGRSAEEVRGTVEAIGREMDAVAKEMAARAAKLEELAKAEGVAAARVYFEKAGVKQAATKLKTETGSEMAAKDIEARLALAALKLTRGESVTEDVADLAGLLMERAKGDYDSYILSELRGTTITLSDSQMKELKAQHRTLAEIRKELAGSGIKIVSGKTDTLDQNWEELCSLIPSLSRDVNDRDMLDELLGVIRSEMNLMRESAWQGDMGKVSGMALEAVMGLVGRAADVDKTTQEMLEYIRNLSGEAEDAAQQVRDFTDMVGRVQKKSAAANNAAELMDRNIGKAIDYFNALTDQSEAAIWRRERVKLIEQMKSEKTDAVLKEQEKWKQRIEKDRNARQMVQENGQVRNQINTNVKRIRKLLVNETDTKNIPEHMKGLARELLRLVTANDLNRNRKITDAKPQDLTEMWRVLTEWRKLDGDFELDQLDSLGDKEVKEVVAEALADIEDGLKFYNSRGTGNGLLENLKGTRNALDRILEGVTTISEIIDSERTISVMDRRVAVADAAADVMHDFGKKKFRGERTGRAGRAADMAHRAVVSGNTTPVYFFKNLRNKGLSEQWQEMERGENRNGIEFQKAKDFLAEVAEKFGYKKWDLNKKYKVSLGGTPVEMTVENLMAMYATWKREHMTGPENSSHMEKGGVFIENDETANGFYGRKKIEQRARRVSQDDMIGIEALLTDEQKDYADAIVKYLSEDMSELGNEASMRMYGIKKYKEKYYFPMKIWDGVKAARSDSGIAGTTENRAAHKSWSKRRINQARNAIVIGNFTDTAVQHIVEMINYNTMAPAIENLNKVLNYQVKEGYGDEQTSRNIRMMFQENYGREALQYLETFMKDLNESGAVQDQRKTLRERMLTVFKKNAVAGSMSVALQQPLSYIRAAMMINPKYLAEALGREWWKGAYDELKRYSGVAVIKDMGRFDMNFGASAKEYIRPEEGQSKAKAAVNWAMDKTTALPEAMDRWTWTRMWVAVKAEQKARNPGMDVKSEEFLRKCAERFNEVMRRTQVYDSMLVKSSNMRSPNYAMKMITSFMAEPTLSLNVLGDAVANVKQEGGKKTLATAAATFLLSAVCQAAVKGAIGTGRTPDEKKTWTENFLYRFVYNLLSEANPASLVPGYGDLIEALKNGELKDDAMSVFGKIRDAYNIIGGKSTGSVYRDIEDTVGQLAQLFTNVPAKNLMRDARAVYNWITQPYAKRETSASVLKYQTLDTVFNADNLLGVINKYLGDAGYVTSPKGYYSRMYGAKKAGDTEAYKGMEEYLKLARGVTGDVIAQNVNAITRKESSLTEGERAAQLIENGATSADEYIIRNVKEGTIGRDEALKLLQEQFPDKDRNDLWWRVDRAVYQKETGAESVSGEYYRLKDAVNSNKSDAIRAAVKELTDHGFGKDKVKKKLSDWKQDYLDGTQQEKVRIRNALEIAYKALGYTKEDADKTINSWKPAKKK